MEENQEQQVKQDAPKRTVTMKGSPMTLVGDELKVGMPAPDFKVVDNGMLPVKFLRTFKGKVTVVSSVPSLDTGICDLQTRRFNKEASNLNNTVVINISADLPFAMARFCGSEGLNNVDNLSVMRGREFMRDYGVKIADGPLAGLTARAVVVLDGNNVVRYTELVSDIKKEPNYDAALAALKAI